MESSLNFISGSDYEFVNFTALNHEDTDAINKSENYEGSTSRNAARERTRVRSLRAAFHSLQMSLPSVPPNTKLSKLDVLVLAANYISHLTKILEETDFEENYEKPFQGSECNNDKIQPIRNGKLSIRRNRNNYLHPVKKWPIRSRLYAGIVEMIEKK